MPSGVSPQQYYATARLELPPSYFGGVRELGLVVLKKDGSEAWIRHIPVPATLELLRELVLKKGAVEVHASTCECPPGGFNTPECAQSEALVEIDAEEFSDTTVALARTVYRTLRDELKLNCSIRYSGNRSIQFVCTRPDGQPFTKNSLAFLRKYLTQCKGYSVDKQALHFCHMRRLAGSLHRKTGLPAVVLTEDQLMSLSAQEIVQLSKSALSQAQHVL